MNFKLASFLRYATPTVIALISAGAGCTSAVSHKRPDSIGSTITLDKFHVESHGEGHARNLVYAAGSVWAIGTRGVLLRISPKRDGEEQIEVPGSAVSVSRTESDEPAVLLWEGLSRNVFVATRLGVDPELDYLDRWSVGPSLHLSSTDAERDVPLSLTIVGGRQIVLSTRSISTLAAGSTQWKTVRLRAPIEIFDASRHVTVVTGGHFLWFGNDAGEWSGSLQRIDIENGEVRNLWSDGPVTGIAQRPGHPGCVVASSGIAHLLMTTGFLLASCGENVETLYNGEQPLWGIQTIGSDLYALVNGGLVPLIATGPDWPKAETFPNVEHEFGGYLAEVLRSNLILYTGARWEVSTSGLTPYAVALPKGTQLKLDQRREDSEGRAN